MGWIGRIDANISIQSITSRLGKFQSATDPPKFKSGRLVTNFGSFTWRVGWVGINNVKNKKIKIITNYNLLLNNLKI